MEEVDEGFILVPKDGGDADDAPDEYLSDIDDFVGSLADSLWPLNLFIHANPELAFNEFKAHDALTRFMRSQRGWHVTSSAYGLKTAWTAVYDSGRKGPVVSFNAEMGTSKPRHHSLLIRSESNQTQTHSPISVTPAATTSSPQPRWQQASPLPR